MHIPIYSYNYAICEVSLQGRISHRDASPTPVCNARYLFHSRIYYTSPNCVKCIYLSRMYALYVDHGVRMHADHTIFTIYCIRWLKSIFEVYSRWYAADFLREQCELRIVKVLYPRYIVPYNSGNFDYSVFINELYYMCFHLLNHFSSGSLT